MQIGVAHAATSSVGLPIRLYPSVLMITSVDQHMRAKQIYLVPVKLLVLLYCPADWLAHGWHGSCRSTVQTVSRGSTAALENLHALGCAGWASKRRPYVPLLRAALAGRLAGTSRKVEDSTGAATASAPADAAECQQAVAASVLWRSWCVGYGVEF
jgi:hypothetical protein